MSARFIAIDEGPDISLDRATVVVGRHPNCDTRLSSPRVSRHHCCMTRENDQVVVRDLGSTNGIRINGERVETGRLRPGDELSIAHIRYRLEGESPVGQGDHRGAALQPALQVPPFPPAQVRRDCVELAFGIGHVVGGDAPARGILKKKLAPFFRGVTA